MADEPKMRAVKPLRNSYMDSPVKASEPKKVYPKITIPFDSIPEAKDWGLGESYNLDVRVTLVGTREDEYAQEATFELRAIGVEDGEEEDEG